MKFKKIIRGKGFDVCSCNPEDLLNELELICGSIESGNNNEEVKNKGIKIIDQLFKTKELSPETHESLYKKYFV